MNNWQAMAYMSNWQAITTKYLPAKNCHGSRISARAQVGKIIVSWDDRLNDEENHIAAAKALASKYEWPQEHLHYGWTHRRECVHIFVWPKDEKK